MDSFILNVTSIQKQQDSNKCAVFPSDISLQKRGKLNCPTVLHGGSDAFIDLCAAERRGQYEAQVGCQGPGFDVRRGSASAKV